jgi:hypothetical protein
MHGREEVSRNTLLILKLYEDELSAAHSGCFSPEENIFIAYCAGGYML